MDWAPACFCSAHSATRLHNKRGHQSINQRLNHRKPSQPTSRRYLVYNESLIKLIMTKASNGGLFNEQRYEGIDLRVSRRSFSQQQCP